MLNRVMAQAQIFRLLFFLRLILLGLDRGRIGGGLHLADRAPGVIEPVAESPVRKDCHQPYRGRHFIEQRMVRFGPDGERAYDQQDDALGAPQKSYVAFRDQRFSPSARVAHHDRADQRRSGQSHIKSAVVFTVARVEDNDPEKNDHVGQPVEARIEKCSELGHPASEPRHTPVQNVEDVGEDHHQAGVKEPPRSVKKRGEHVDAQSDHRKQVRVWVKARNLADDAIKYALANFSYVSAEHISSTSFSLKNLKVWLEARQVAFEGRIIWSDYSACQEIERMSAVARASVCACGALLNGAD